MDNNNWLVVEPHPSEKYEWKSVGMIFHSQLILESHNPNVPVTTNQYGQLAVTVIYLLIIG